jgi:hypothetical protein
MRIITFACLLFLSVPSMAQMSPSSVPAAVTAAFTSSVPGVKPAYWEKEHALYEGHYTLETGQKVALVFNEKGELQGIERIIPVSDLPAAASAYIAQEFKGAAIQEAALALDNAGAPSYEVKVGGKLLLFDNAGKLIGSH